MVCKVSIVEAIKYQNKDANHFAVLTVLWLKSININYLNLLEKLSSIHLLSYLNKVKMGGANFEQ